MKIISSLRTCIKPSGHPGSSLVGLKFASYPSLSESTKPSSNLPTVNPSNIIWKWKQQFAFNIFIFEFIVFIFFSYKLLFSIQYILLSSLPVALLFSSHPCHRRNSIFQWTKLLFTLWVSHRRCGAVECEIEMVVQERGNGINCWENKVKIL